MDVKMVTAAPCRLVALIVLSATLLSCGQQTGQENQDVARASKHSAIHSRSDSQAKEVTPLIEGKQRKPVVYQVFTRLFGNTNETNKPWGNIEENGVGKFSDFTPTALNSIKALGVSHIWYTGVLHHASMTDYREYGIPLDDPDVIKGRAGSPYAIRDYYNVNPDLANEPANRLDEFLALIKRTHEHGMKVVIDIVPNHVARNYHSLSAPEGVSDFGAHDDKSVAYAKDNNFYYVVDETFRPPTMSHYEFNYLDSHPLADKQFSETPAKWTGNGARTATPDINDWYETVKVNYGVRPDGSYDFPVLPEAYSDKTASEHAAFWENKALPDSWYKLRDIAFYWLDKGVDGFRYDMAEMVPVEFWSFLNSAIKQAYPEAFLLAEVYQPSQYRQYISLGKMDYLYDKVGFYDTLKPIMQGNEKVSELINVHDEVHDISENMLHFLENHDEQRIASKAFATHADFGKPALVVSALMCKSPMLLYFGQDVGEDGSEDMGFGAPSRTTIFDYAGVPAHQRFMNKGEFDGGQSTLSEKALRTFYENVMNIAASHEAMQGEFISLHKENLDKGGYTEQQFAFIRRGIAKSLLVVTNFSDKPTDNFTLTIPIPLSDNRANQQVRELQALMTHENAAVDPIETGFEITLRLDGLESHIYQFSH